MSDSRTGEKNSFYGKTHSEESKRKIKEARERQVGERCPAWKGGLTKRPGYRSFLKKRSKLRKLANGGSHTFGDWENLKVQYNWTCPSCHKKEPEIKLTEDHVIPSSKGGSDNIENIQPLCKSCNSHKMTKIIKF
jgi:5-methylcytosine-specific restriction endonuclease McrA